MSTQKDANKFLEMIETCFVSAPILRRMPQNWNYCSNYLQEFLHNDFKDVPNQHNVELHNNVPNIGINIANKELRAEFELKGTLTGISLYPIKSCGSFSVNQWSITDKGLKYDREWMIVNSQGTAFTQKNSKKLCLLKPHIDLEERVMKINIKGE